MLFRSALPDRQIIFRLHPSESLGDFERLVAAESDVPTNFELSAREPNIFALLASADTQVGVFSTTLLEGMALGCKTAIVALPGFEYMQRVVERGDASIAKTEADVVECIRTARECKDPSYYYAKQRRRLL